MCDDLAVTGGQYPSWRARIVLGDEPAQHAERSQAAWHHLDGDVFERYLRMVGGTTAI